MEKAQKNLSDEKVSEEKLYRQLVKEKEDLNKLEGLSLTALFYTLLGRKEQQLDKEQQEYLAAKLKYDEVKENVEAIEAEVKKYKAELKILGNPEPDYERLLKAKELMLLETDGDKARRLMEISEEEARLFQWDKELRQALQAGQEVVNSLRKLRNELQSAGGWGTFDMLGGGLLATSVKHSKINNAKAQVHKVQRQMHLFLRELADVQINTKINIDIGGLAKFADYFFDGFIIDWIVQSKINDSLAQTNRQLEGVKRIIKKLKSQLVQTEITVKQLKGEKKLLIE